MAKSMSFSITVFHTPYMKYAFPNLSSHIIIFPLSKIHLYTFLGVRKQDFPKVFVCLFEISINVPDGLKMEKDKYINYLIDRHYLTF